MIIIIDSGSSKTSWLITDFNKHKELIFTIGLNPYFHTIQSIQHVVNTNICTKVNKENVQIIYFYGAGCSHPSKISILKSAFSSIFPNASVFIDTDLLGASRSLFDDKPGIVAILGTGSNICFYNGYKPEQSIFSLGYILGDEGSGAYLGKILIKNYLTGKLPLELNSEFNKEFNYLKYCRNNG